jgi:hypothetical protein
LEQPLPQIKDLLAYLQIIDNPHFVPGFSRAINTPNRGIGDKVTCWFISGSFSNVVNEWLQTLKEILARASELNISPLSVVEQIYDGQIPDVKPSAKKKLKAFVEPLRTLRRLAESVSCFISQFASLTDSGTWSHRELPQQTLFVAYSTWWSMRSIWNTKIPIGLLDGRMYRSWSILQPRFRVRMPKKTAVRTQMKTRERSKSFIGYFQGCLD